MHLMRYVVVHGLLWSGYSSMGRCSCVLWRKVKQLKFLSDWSTDPVFLNPDCKGKRGKCKWHFSRKCLLQWAVWQMASVTDDMPCQQPFCYRITPLCCLQWPGRSVHMGWQWRRPTGWWDNQCHSNPKTCSCIAGNWRIFNANKLGNGGAISLWLLALSYF